MDEEWYVFLIVVVVGIIFFGLLDIATTSDWEKDAVEHNCAQYNPQTSKFEWLDKK